MSRFNFFVVILLIFTMLPASTSASAQSPQVTQVTNGIYDIFVRSSNRDIGTYTIRTGANHPVTLNMGQPQSVLFNGDSGVPGTSYNTIRSYTTNTDYVAGPNPTSSFSVVDLDAYSIGTIVLSDDEIETTWQLPGPPATPDKPRITQSIRIFGTTFSDSSIAVKVSVFNLGTSPVALGVRYLWDVEIGVDDGPILIPENADGTEQGPWQTEKQFDPAFDSYFIQDNDENPSPPTFGIHGTVTGPTSFLPTIPSALQFASWPHSYNKAFDYTVEEWREIATNGGDSAVIYLFGHDLANAYTIPASETLSVETKIFATLADADSDGDRLLDSWEITDQDMNGDGIIDVGPSVGSDQIRKIFMLR